MAKPVLPRAWRETTYFSRIYKCKGLELLASAEISGSRWATLDVSVIEPRERTKRTADAIRRLRDLRFKLTPDDGMYDPQLRKRIPLTGLSRECAAVDRIARRLSAAR